MTDEDKVRAAWESVTAGPDGYGYGITLSTRPPHTYVGFEKARDAWAAAAAFTAERRQAIADVDKEIACLEVDVRRAEASLRPAYKRILKSRQAHRAELARGMKPAQHKESR